jgi:hypothetical protein
MDGRRPPPPTGTRGHGHRVPGWRQAAALALLLLSGVPVAGDDIYRYQDAQGVWQFTDEPPPGVEADLVPNLTTGRKTAAGATEDEPARVGKTFEPVTPLARATRAVVAVEGRAAGSGFFCTPDGHLLTNRRVVRAIEQAPLPGSVADPGPLAPEQRALEEQLMASERRLRAMQKDLAGYERVLRGAQDETARAWAEDAQAQLAERHQAEKARAAALFTTLDALRRRPAAETPQSLGSDGDNGAEEVFRVLLRDGSRVQARLIAVSTEHDLALLKVDGLRTPYLRLDRPVFLGEGQRLFAIGSPQGMQAAITSGLLTRIDPDALHIDAPIPPSVGGGPLITEDGALAGINLPPDPEADASAFPADRGKAIPADAALRAFPQILAGPTD